MPVSIDQAANQTIHSELQKLSPDAIVELFVLDLQKLGGGLYYFHAGTNAMTQPIIWQGVTYTPLPVIAEGFTYDGSGTLPRPKLKMANVHKVISSFVVNYADMVGAKVIRRRTFSRFLDGQPEANPLIQFQDESWYIDRKTVENRLYVEWELASPWDTDTVLIPGRIVTNRSCVWKYKGEGCGYTGTSYFKADDTATSDPAEDTCGKRLSSCKLRFGQTLPFGGFPGVKGY